MRPTFPHITIAFHIGPVLCEYLGAIGVNLYLPFTSHPCPFQAKVKAAYPSEEAAKGHPRHGLPLSTHAGHQNFVSMYCQRGGDCHGHRMRPHPGQRGSQELVR